MGRASDYVPTIDTSVSDLGIHNPIDAKQFPRDTLAFLRSRLSVKAIAELSDAELRQWVDRFIRWALGHEPGSSRTPHWLSRLHATYEASAETTKNHLFHIFWRQRRNQADMLSRGKLKSSVDYDDDSSDADYGSSDVPYSSEQQSENTAQGSSAEQRDLLASVTTPQTSRGEERASVKDHGTVTVDATQPSILPERSMSGITTDQRIEHQDRSGHLKRKSSVYPDEDEEEIQMPKKRAPGPVPGMTINPPVPLSRSPSRTNTIPQRSPVGLNGRVPTPAAPNDGNHQSAAAATRQGELAVPEQTPTAATNGYVPTTVTLYDRVFTLAEAARYITAVLEALAQWSSDTSTQGNDRQRPVHERKVLRQYGNLLADKVDDFDQLSASLAAADPETGALNTVKVNGHDFHPIDVTAFATSVLEALRDWSNEMMRRGIELGSGNSARGEEARSELRLQDCCEDRRVR